MRAKVKYLAIIQAYRGLVAVMILLTHALTVWYMRGFEQLLGFVHSVLRSGGVDFFFTLSGFLISYIYLRGAGRPGEAGAFLERRLLRIYPLVWFFTLLSLPAFFMFSGIGDGGERQPAVIVKSLLLWPQEANPVLGATWSLSHIVLFYLVFATYLRWPRATLAGIALWIVVAVAWGAGLLIPPEDSGAVLAFLLHPFNLEFLVGALFARFVRDHRVNFGLLWLLGGIAGFVATWLLSDRQTPPWPLAAVYCASSIALIAGGVGIEGDRTIRLPQWMSTLGDASYAIIVVNLPVIVLSNRIVERVFPIDHHSAGIAFLCVAASSLAAIAGGIVAYHLVDKPLGDAMQRLVAAARGAFRERHAGS
jgi:peptidoglycan/LPS O-acetylase OafA/YrhL